MKPVRTQRDSSRAPFPPAPAALDKRALRALRAIRDDDAFVTDVAHLRAVHTAQEAMARIQPGVIEDWLTPRIEALRAAADALPDLARAKPAGGYGSPSVQTSGIPGFQALLVEVALAVPEGVLVSEDFLLRHWRPRLYMTWEASCLEPLGQLEDIAIMLEQVRDRLRAMKKRGRPRKRDRQVILDHVQALASRYALTADEKARTLAAVFPGLSPATIEPPTRLAAAVARKRAASKMRRAG